MAANITLERNGILRKDEAIEIALQILSDHLWDKRDGHKTGKTTYEIEIRDGGVTLKKIGFFEMIK